MIIVRAIDTSIKDETKVISALRQELMESDIVKDFCKNKGVPIDDIMGVHIEYKDLDVSAKTVDGKIFLNRKLLEKDFKTNFRYLIHEFVHNIQHQEREHMVGDPYADDEYLDRPDEIEAFQKQIEYQKESESEEDVIEYVEELVDYHNVPSDKKEDKINELMNGKS